MSRVDDITDNLREKHGHMYSNLQYRVWAETIVGGRHASYFKKSKILPSRDLSSVNFERGNPTTVITPVKAAELKTIYISQIKELYSLLEVGAPATSVWS